MNDQFFIDLLSWYHLAWLGHSLKQLPRVKGLLGTDGTFSAEARRELLEIMSEAFDRPARSLSDTRRPRTD